MVDVADDLGDLIASRADSLVESVSGLLSTDQGKASKDSPTGSRVSRKSAVGECGILEPRVVC